MLAFFLCLSQAKFISASAILCLLFPLFVLLILAHLVDAEVCHTEPPSGPRSSSPRCRECWWQQLSVEICGMTPLEIAGLPKVLLLPGGSYPMAGHWRRQYQGLALLPAAGTTVKGFLLQNSQGVS